MHIESITIYSAALEATRNFYRDTLEFPILKESETYFTLQIGSTVFTFRQASLGDTPFYHFAFDVPSNQFEQAKNWIKERVSLLKNEGHDEVYFPSIDAKSIYFEDPSGNIVEWICRLTDSPASSEPFHPTLLQKASEMSLVVHDKLNAAKQLESIRVYSRDHQPVSAEGLTFLGERKDAVYLLLVSENRVWYFSEKVSTVHPLTVESKNFIIQVTPSGELICTSKQGPSNPEKPLAS